MRRTLAALAIALGLAQLAAPAARAEDEIWVWTTPDGAVHYTDDWERVPEAFRDRARVAHREGSGSYQRVEGRTPVPPAAQPEAAPAPDAPPPLDAEAAAEAAWREQARAVAARIAALTQQVDGCASDHVNQSPGDGSRKRREERAEAERCAQARRDLAEAQADREALEERAHREGVPPGWLRVE